MNVLILTKSRPNLLRAYLSKTVSEYIQNEPSFGGWNDGFVDSGHKVFLNWEESFFLSTSLKIRFLSIYRALSYLMRITGLKKLDRLLFSKKIALYCKSNRIDLIFTELNGSISPKFIRHWYPDVVCTEWFGVFPDMAARDTVRLASEYDILWTPCEFDMNKVAFDCISSIRYIGSSFNEKFYYHDFDPQFAFDVVFVGGVCGKHKNRLDFLEEIAKSFENFAFYGYGNELIPQGYKLKEKFMGYATPDILRKLFSSSKIAVNLTLDGYDRATRGFNERLFEIAACGGALQLCLNDSKLNEYFVVGEDLDVFSDKESLIEKIKHYLADEALREKNVSSSYMKSKSYTCIRKVRQMIDYVYSSKPALKNEVVNQ